MASRLELRNVSKTFAGRTVLRDVDLTVEPGELHGLIGQNGSGKSTLAKIGSGYHAPDAPAPVPAARAPAAAAGRAAAGARRPLGVRLRDLRRASVSIVYQDLGLIPDATVVENVRI